MTYKVMWKKNQTNVHCYDIKESYS